METRLTTEDAENEKFFKLFFKLIIVHDLMRIFLVRSP